VLEQALCGMQRLEILPVNIKDEFELESVTVGKKIP
jgi:hypothetical protein